MIFPYDINIIIFSYLEPFDSVYYAYVTHIIPNSLTFYNICTAKYQSIMQTRGRTQYSRLPQLLIDLSRYISLSYCNYSDINTLTYTENTINFIKCIPRKHLKSFSIRFTFGKMDKLPTNITFDELLVTGHQMSVSDIVDSFSEIHTTNITKLRFYGGLFVIPCEHLTHIDIIVDLSPKNIKRLEYYIDKNKKLVYIKVASGIFAHIETTEKQLFNKITMIDQVVVLHDSDKKLLDHKKFKHTGHIILAMDVVCKLTMSQNIVIRSTYADYSISIETECEEYYLEIIPSDITIILSKNVYKINITNNDKRMIHVISNGATLSTKFDGPNIRIE